MKNLLLIIALFFVFPSAGRYQEKGFPVTVITISRTTLQVATSLQHKNDKWTKLHVKPLQKGLNTFDCRLNEGQRVEFFIWNY